MTHLNHHIFHRDIKNDETGFCLVLPADFIMHHAEVEATITQVDSWGSGAEDDIDGKSISSSKKFRLTPLFKKSTRTEIIYHFHTILDGNEKFIWLQAASELGRLCSETAKSSVPIDVKK